MLISRDYIHDGWKIDNMEWAFALDEECDVLRRAMHPIFDFIKKRLAEGKFPMSQWMEMRIMADSDAYLSPAIAGNCNFNLSYK